MSAKLLKISLTIVSGVTLVLIFYLNIKLYHAPEISVMQSDTLNYDLLCELRALQGAMENNEAEKMQQLYPEGYIFFNALYGLSWIEFIKSIRAGSKLHAEGHDEIQKAYNNINSNRGREIFDESLNLPYGAFYSGWTTYLLGQKLSVEHPDKRSRDEIERFKKQCDKIAEVVRGDIYPASYFGKAWPADVVVCMAALALYDRIFESRYSESIQHWLHRVKQDLDPIGLIPHAVETDSNKPMENARGSSQSLMLNFLWGIDREFANEQFVLYKKHFLDYRFGLPGIREYPKGNVGVCDVDSGPVIFGIGAAASIVGLRTMSLYGEKDISIAMRNSIEAFGFPFANDGHKKYLFGQLPIADAFIAWSHSGNRIKMIDEETDNRWRMSFQLYSTALVILLILATWWMWRKP